MQSQHLWYCCFVLRHAVYSVLYRPCCPLSCQSSSISTGCRRGKTVVPYKAVSAKSKKKGLNLDYILLFLDFSPLEHSLHYSMKNVLSTISESLNLATLYLLEYSPPRCTEDSRIGPLLPEPRFFKMRRAINKRLLDQCLTTVLFLFVCFSSSKP